MNHTNDTNVVVHGSGTAQDPYTFNFHASPMTTSSFTARSSGLLPLGIWVVFFVSLFFWKKLTKKEGEKTTRSFLVWAMAPVVFFVFWMICSVFRSFSPVIVSN